MRITAGAYNLADGAIPEVDGAPIEPWSAEAAAARLRRLTPRLPVTVPPDAVLLTSNSNDVWQFGDAVLRVCWRGDRARLLREARLTAALPAAIPHPRVQATGADGDVSWALAERVDGAPLDTVWADADPAQRRRLVAQLMQALRALHAWTPPADLARALGDPPAAVEDALAIVGRSVVPLPLARLRPVLAFARAMPFVDGRVLDAAAARAEELAAVWPADEAQWVLTHGDAAPVNILVRDGAIVALLDFEWARLGPADLELVPFVAWSERLGASEGWDALLGWAREAYPELFAAPDRERRLWLYQLAYTIRGLVVWPADREEAALPVQHPVRRLRTLVERPAVRLG